jgi:hypothetical protein
MTRLMVLSQIEVDCPNFERRAVLISLETRIVAGDAFASCGLILRDF